MIDDYPGAWLVWCDPHGEWASLLKLIAVDAKLDGFHLLAVEETTAAEIGGRLMRRALQEQFDAGEPLVELMHACAFNLGWL